MPRRGVSGSMSPERTPSGRFKRITVVDRYHSYDDLRSLQSACHSRRSPSRPKSRRRRLSDSYIRGGITPILESDPLNEANLKNKRGVLTTRINALWKDYIAHSRGSSSDDDVPDINDLTGKCKPLTLKITVPYECYTLLRPSIGSERSLCRLANRMTMDEDPHAACDSQPLKLRSPAREPNSRTVPHSGALGSFYTGYTECFLEGVERGTLLAAVLRLTSYVIKSRLEGSPLRPTDATWLRPAVACISEDDKQTAKSLWFRWAASSCSLYAMRGLLTGAVSMIPLVLCPDPYMRASLSAALIARAVEIAAMRLLMRLVRTGHFGTSAVGDTDSVSEPSEGGPPRLGTADWDWGPLEPESYEIKVSPPRKESTPTEGPTTNEVVRPLQTTSKWSSVLQQLMGTASCKSAGCDWPQASNSRRCGVTRLMAIVSVGVLRRTHSMLAAIGLYLVLSPKLEVLSAATIERAVLFGGVNSKSSFPALKSGLRYVALSALLHLLPQLLRKTSIVGAVSQDWQTLLSRSVSTSTALMMLRWMPELLQRSVDSVLPDRSAPMIKIVERFFICWLTARTSSKMLCSLDLRLMLSVSLLAWPLRAMSIRAMETVLGCNTTALLDPLILAPLLGPMNLSSAGLAKRLGLFAVEAALLGAAGATLLDAYLRQPLLVSVVDYKVARRLLDDDRKHIHLFYDGDNRIALHRVI
ncbi:hypothetical protein FOL47_002588 [Perkinsus chesapeaki]|uniref:Uncharacterized protein n=1 Tax=Perkinsus chesapeaki TaxID=330153 RepID=A0A7J6MDA7_PERCH|nr:hypothetical protein FOL47_002588 [Perkinsus chesapeaki]